VSGLDRLRIFVQDMTALVERTPHEPAVLAEGERLLAALVGHDDWLPDEFAQPHPQYYQQYLLHCDPHERFSVVSFVWGPGQRTPIHDHTVWGLIGMLRGAESCQSYSRGRDGRLIAGAATRLTPGTIAAVSPRIGDIHLVTNAYDDRPSISIHVYGANIGAVARHVYDGETGAPKDFVSGYASARLPNFWDRSRAVRAGL
jgi:3-mercaptopropionate dioxygenase